MSEPINLTAVKRGAVIPMSRDMRLAAGVVEPTAEERAEMERSAAEARRRAEARVEGLAAARERLDAITDPLARAVLDLHRENERHECEGDDMDGYECEYPAWPCRTVEAVAEHYGIPLESW